MGSISFPISLLPSFTHLLSAYSALSMGDFVSPVEKLSGKWTITVHSDSDKDGVKQKVVGAGVTPKFSLRRDQGKPSGGGNT